MKTAKKIISLLLTVSLVAGITVALAFSAFAVETPTITITEKSNDGSKIVVEVAVTKGYINNTDIRFKTTGLDCKNISASKGTGNANAPAGYANFAVASVEPITGKLFTATFVIDGSAYSFDLDVTTCGVTDDIKYDDYDNIISSGETYSVTPVIKGAFSGSVADGVRSVEIEDISVQYKDSATIVPVIDAAANAEYTVAYTSSNTDVVVVDEDGNITTQSKGSAEITCTVTDSNGNVVEDTCNVEVTFAFWQWIIYILLLGFIWY